MSREFGSYSAGYFHTQIEYAADDCLGGRYEITRLWGAFLREFEAVAYAIASCEACDSAEYDPIMRSIEWLPILRKKLDEIGGYCKPFQRCMEEAVRGHVEKQALK